jgi:predicted  nucleic acid-binding Zn-ribbon protein
LHSWRISNQQIILQYCQTEKSLNKIKTSSLQNALSAELQSKLAQSLQKQKELEQLSCEYEHAVEEIQNDNDDFEKINDIERKFHEKQLAFILQYENLKLIFNRPIWLN